MHLRGHFQYGDCHQMRLPLKTQSGAQAASTHRMQVAAAAAHPGTGTGPSRMSQWASYRTRGIPPFGSCPYGKYSLCLNLLLKSSLFATQHVSVARWGLHR
eukprot:scpid76155/ scgid23109/ 